jgi:nucleoid DNA-binding protein
MSRVKVEYRTGERKVYDQFCLKYPDITINFDEWKEIIYTYNSLFREYLLETGDRAKLPYGIGTFAIAKKKPKKTKTYAGKEYMNMPIDWQKSRKAGKRIYNFNAHTDGNRFRWLWFNRGYRRFYHSDLWTFKPSRETSRKITEYLKRPRQVDLYKQWNPK